MSTDVETDFLTFEFFGVNPNDSDGESPTSETGEQVDESSARSLPDTDALKIISVTGTEAVSDCFHFTLTFVAVDEQALGEKERQNLEQSGALGDGREYASTLDWALRRLVGSVGTLGIARDPARFPGAQSRRYIRGVVTQISSVPNEGSVFPKYQAEFVPWFWLLKHRKNCRVFQNKSVIAIAEEIFEEWRVFPEVAYNLDAISVEDYKPLNYCVQYRESDFDFISRILEREGIFYFFDWKNATTTLFLADDNTAFFETNQDLDGEPSQDCAEGIAFFADRIVNVSETVGLREWKVEHRLIQGNSQLSDFDYLHPSSAFVLPSTPTLARMPESRDYPADFVHRWPEDFTPSTPEDNVAMRGARLQTIAQQARETEAARVEFKSDYAHFQTGRELVDVAQLGGLSSEPTAPSGEELPGGSVVFPKGQQLVLKIEHNASQPHVTSEDGNRDVDYSNTVTCIPAVMRYRATQGTRKPVVEGPQTAIVVGAAGQTTDLNVEDDANDMQVAVDDLGRVKVRFHWDGREEQGGEDTSCWVRVSQEWAGQGYGSFHLPHLGQEVIVSFLEGDPDRPLITGRVYNSKNKVSKIARVNDDMDKVKGKSFANDDSRAKVAVVSRDQVGNQVLFDSTDEDEHVLISSPGQDTYIRVGNPSGIVVRTEGSLTELFEGWDVRYTFANSAYVTCGVGVDVQIGGSVNAVVGTAVDAYLGSRLEASLAFESRFAAAGKLEVGVGASYSMTKESSLQESADDFLTRTDSNIVLDAQDTITIVGGADSGNGRIVSDSNGIEMTVGKGNAVPGAAALWKTHLTSCVAAVAAATSAIAIPVATAVAVSTNPPSHDEMWEGDEPGLISAGIASGVTSIAAAAALIVAAKTAKKRVRTKAHKTKTTGAELRASYARLYSDSTGQKTTNFFLVNGSSKQAWMKGSTVKITSDGTITIQGTTIALSAPTATLNGQNLKVIE